MSQRIEGLIGSVTVKRQQIRRKEGVCVIMLKMQAHLGKNQPSEQLTCEPQVGGRRHMMDADTLEDQLQLLQPQTVTGTVLSVCSQLAV